MLLVVLTKYSFFLIKQRQVTLKLYGNKLLYVSESDVTAENKVVSLPLVSS